MQTFSRFFSCNEREIFFEEEEAFSKAVISIIFCNLQECTVLPSWGTRSCSSLSGNVQWRSNYSVVPIRGWFCSHFYSNGWLYSHHLSRYVSDDRINFHCGLLSRTILVLNSFSHGFNLFCPRVERVSCNQVCSGWLVHIPLPLFLCSANYGGISLECLRSCSWFGPRAGGGWSSFWGSFLRLADWWTKSAVLRRFATINSAKWWRD